VRAVLDVNVIVSALLSANGAPARVLTSWHSGSFELLASPLLLAELRRTLAYPKLAMRIEAEAVERMLRWLVRSVVFVPDPATPPAVRSADPDDDYLIALAAAGKAYLVSGDDHLLSLRGPGLPILSPAEFLALLDARG
jgi:hypothetical protein